MRIRLVSYGTTDDYTVFEFEDQDGRPWRVSAIRYSEDGWTERVGVALKDRKAFCRWLPKQELSPDELPTDYETLKELLYRFYTRSPVSEGLSMTVPNTSIQATALSDGTVRVEDGNGGRITFHEASVFALCNTIACVAGSLKRVDQ